MRHINEDGLLIVKRFEGFKSKPYICPAGWLTIGYGHVIKHSDNFKNGITEDEAIQILSADLFVAERAVTRFVKAPINDNQFSALVSFTFNLGAGALQRSTMRAKINREEHEAIPREFMKWVYAGPRILPGLVKRRQAEAKLYSL